MEAVIQLGSAMRLSLRTALLYVLLLVLGFHALELLVFRHGAILESRILTAAIPALAAICGLWRAQRVAPRERPAWRWISASLFLWAGGQVVEALLQQSAAASNLSVDASDFLYISAALPLLLAVSSTKETESIGAVTLLDAALVAVALVLTYFRLFRMEMPPAQAATVMLWIYAAECSLLAIATLMRLVTWATREERRRIGLLGRVVWIYLPIELGMDFATRRWNLQSGTLLDLLWSVPFVYAGWQALKMPFDEIGSESRKPQTRSRLILESLCPLLLTAGVFALAASVAGQYRALALSAIFLLLMIQGMHASLVQLNYLTGQHLLLKREQELEGANSALEKLSNLDPLTGIPNRRRFTSALDGAWKAGLQTGEPISVLMIDVDLFKGVNDLYGHLYGDLCLKTIADLLCQQASRSSDLVARYGGEEFVVLLPKTNEFGARILAERILAAVARLAFPNAASPFDGMLTVSIGLAVDIPRPEIGPAELVDKADQALYQAKHQGRNRIWSSQLQILGADYAVEPRMFGTGERA